MTHLDWRAIAEQLRGLELLINEFRVFDEKAWLAKIVRGQPDLRLPDTIDEGLHYIAREEHARNVLLAVRVQFGLTEADDLPSEDVPRFLQRPPAIEVVRNGINTQTMSSEFIEAWGTLNSVDGAFSYFLFEHERFERRALGDAKSRESTTTEDQRFFYAKWTRDKATGFKPKDRTGSDQQLVELCLGIEQGLIAAPKGWPPSWFALLLQDADGKEKYQLRTTYRNMSAEIVKNLADKLDQQNRSLPPTDHSAYRKKLKT